MAYVAFDLDGLDAAFEELDARYLAGEAAPYARTWSVLPSAIPQHSTVTSSCGDTPTAVISTTNVQQRYASRRAAGRTPAGHMGSHAKPSHTTWNPYID